MRLFLAYTSMDYYLFEREKISQLNLYKFICEKLSVLFTNLPGIPFTGFIGEIRWLFTYAGDSPIAENGNTFLIVFLSFKKKRYTLPK